MLVWQHRNLCNDCHDNAYILIQFYEATIIYCGCASIGSTFDLPCKVTSCKGVSAQNYNILRYKCFFFLLNRKVEDLQFRVEEACITKGDLEVKEQPRSTPT